MPEVMPLISICICTYKRPTLLNKLLLSLASQTLDDYEIVVVDNDAEGSANSTIEDFQRKYNYIRIHYAIEPRQGISYARNRTVKMAIGNYIAFVDDDEVADPSWLQNHLDCLIATNADATLGPVLPVFPTDSKQWAIKSKLFERPRYQNQATVGSDDGRTGNALVKALWCKERSPTCFKEALAKTGGEDHDFFKWVEYSGGLLVWADTAVVREIVPLQRQDLLFILERRFRSSVTYWRDINESRSKFAGIFEALKGAAGGGIFVIAGLLVLTMGLGKALPYWVKAMNGFGRVAALSKIHLIGYGGQHE